MAALVYLDGKIDSPENTKVSVFDRGFLFGDGVYETGKSLKRCPLFLEEHWGRLRRSAEKLQIRLPWTDDELTRGLFELCAAFGKDALYFRTIITRGVIESVSLEIESKKPTLVHLVQDLSVGIESMQKHGIKLLTSKIIRNSPLAQDPNIKTSNYLNCLLALQDTRGRGAEDAVLCDREGNLTEGTTFSVFGATSHGALITPELGVGILSSITRRHVIQLAHKEMEVREGKFKIAEFLKCPETFIASSIREIVPIRSWDGVEFKVLGNTTARLQRLLAEEIREYVEGHGRY